MVLLLLFKKEDYIYTTGVTIWNGKVNILSHLFIDIYRYIVGLLGSLSIIIIISKIINKLPKIIKTFFIECGKYSMYIYILQSATFEIYRIIITWLSNYIENNIFINNMLLYNFFLTPILAVTTVLLILLVSKKIMVNKKISKLFFGR